MNYYQILNIENTVSQQEIKYAFRKLSLQHHPDKGGDINTYQKIVLAYETLSNEEMRKEYDLSLKKNTLTDKQVLVIFQTGFITGGVLGIATGIALSYSLSFGYSILKFILKIK